MLFRRILAKTLAYHIYQWSRRRVRRYLARRAGWQITSCSIRLDMGRCTPFMRDVVLDGWYELPERLLCSTYLTRQDRVLEIGAAIGFIAMYCMKVIGISSYTLVEANPETTKLLHRNLELNGLQATVLNYALSDHDGFEVLDVSGEFWANHLDAAVVQGQGVTVPARTITSLLSESGMQPTALIVDIEGSERHLDPSSLPPTIATLIIELHPQHLGLDTMFQMLAAYQRAGFRIQDRRQDTYCLKRDPIAAMD